MAQRCSHCGRTQKNHTTNGVYRACFAVGFTSLTGQMDRGQTVREIARERIGTVPASKVMIPKKDRKPKHKEPIVPEY